MTFVGLLVSAKFLIMAERRTGVRVPSVRNGGDLDLNAMARSTSCPDRIQFLTAAGGRRRIAPPITPARSGLSKDSNELVRT